MFSDLNARFQGCAVMVGAFLYLFLLHSPSWAFSPHAQFVKHFYKGALFDCVQFTFSSLFPPFLAIPPFFVLSGRLRFMLWVREGELMENVKPACSAALALTRADCGMTPAVLPRACSWNPISSQGYGACFSGPV